MPIPTRRLSLREPRIGQQRKPPGLDLEATIPEVESPRSIKPRSKTISSTTSALTSVAAKNSNLPSHNLPISGLPQPATIAAAPTNSGGNGGNGGDSTLAARRRSFLPQRSTWHKAGAGDISSGKSGLQLQDSELQRGAQIQEIQAPAPQSPVLARPVETSAAPPDLSQQPPPPLSPSKLCRPATSPTRPRTIGMSRLERRGSMNAPKLDALKSPDIPTTRRERAGSSSTTSSQLSRPHSVHIITKVERSGFLGTTASQVSRPQSKPTQRTERVERPGLGHTSKPEAPKPQSANATRLERSASLRQPISSRATTTVSHSRHQSQIEGSTKGHTGLKQGDASTNSTPPLKANKPQFSTFQQHYSPKKGPKTKPPLPLSATSPSTPTATGTGIEPSSQTHPHIAALRIELFQLHLLHADSLRARREWESSADQQLRKQHKSVVSKYHTLLAREQAAQRHVNYLALNKLAADSKANTKNIHNHSSRGPYDFSEQIQVLSRVIQDVAALTDPCGGRYFSCVRTFERWFEHVARVRQGRTGSRNRSLSREPAIDKYGDVDGYDDAEQNNNDDAQSSSKFEFIDPLSFKWKEEVAALAVKVELCARELDCLDVDVRIADGEEKDVDIDGECGNGYPPSSALVRTVNGHKMLLASMVEELEVMSAVEADIGKLERLWVRDAVDRLSPGGTAVGKEEIRPAWIVG